MNKYKNFSVEDLLHDEFFNEWVKNTSSKNDEVWQNWLTINPEMAEIVMEAKSIILAFDYQPETVSEDFYTTLKRRIDFTTGTESQKQPLTRSIPQWLKLVAVFAGVFLITGFLYYSFSGKDFITVSSRYAETKNTVLPDGSEVALNANSSLKYPGKWNNSYREAWLKGEAFFKIKHTESTEKVPLKFIVHTADMNVEVLGTQFNINSNGSNEDEVLLTSGKIKLSISGREDQPLIMNPGELADYNSETKIVSVNKVDPENYIAWINHKYIFEKTSLEDVCRELHRYYGIAVTIEDVKMRKQLLSGTLELQNEETLTATLSALLGVKVYQNKKQIFIFSK